MINKYDLYIGIVTDLFPEINEKKYMVRDLEFPNPISEGEYVILGRLKPFKVKEVQHAPDRSILFLNFSVDIGIGNKEEARANLKRLEDSLSAYNYDGPSLLFQ